MKTLALTAALSLLAAIFTNGSAVAQGVDTQVNGTIIWNTDTGQVTGSVGGQASQTRGGTTTGAGIQYDGTNVTGKIIIDDKKPQEPPKR